MDKTQTAYAQELIKTLEAVSKINAVNDPVTYQKYQVLIKQLLKQSGLEISASKNWQEMPAKYFNHIEIIHIEPDGSKTFKRLKS